MNSALRRFAESLPRGDVRSNPYPVDTSALLAHLVRLQEQSEAPVEVSFRQLVPWLKMGERATHYLHPYPAKLLPQIVHFFLAARTLGQATEVLDPFAGTGTVALEAALAGRESLHSDANPLARLITRAKLNPIARETAVVVLAQIEAAYSRLVVADVPEVVNIDYWYDAFMIRDLARLREAILRISCGAPADVSDFLWTTFSAVARRCSRADPRFYVPVRARGVTQRLKSALCLFREQFEANLRRYAALIAYRSPLPATRSVGDDARDLREPTGPGDFKGESQLADASVDMIITSPPYAGAQKYIRASSLSLGWLGWHKHASLKELENSSIGREHLPKAVAKDLRYTGVASADAVLRQVFERNPLRAAICATYLAEMTQAIDEMSRVMRVGGHLVLIIGNNEVCGQVFDSASYLSELCGRVGLKRLVTLIDGIPSRALLTTRASTAGIIRKEWIMLFRKEPQSR